MSAKSLELAPALQVKRAIAAATVFIAGTKGSGKTHNAGVIAEELLAAGVHTVILDPLGVWWGLRHDRGGGPGGFPILILGGEHGDVPLSADKGDVVAEFIVRTGQPCILDMSGFDSDAEQDRFVTALLKKLFRLKSIEKANLHLIMDEADMFAPQSPQPGQQVMLGATKTIVTKGRSRGLSMTMITQRPQSISTALRDEADVFLCHRILGPRAADAVRTWVDQHASAEQAKEFMKTLPTLNNGECWVWSPHFLKLFERHRFRLKKTFDSSRTPDPGETVRKVKASAEVDLATLTAEMKKTADEAKANDPKELKRLLAEKDRELAQLRQQAGRAKPDPAAAARAGELAAATRQQERIIARLRSGLEEAMKVLAEITAKGFEKTSIDPEQVRQALDAAAAQIVKLVEQKESKREADFAQWRKEANQLLGRLQKLMGEDVSVKVAVQHNEPFTINAPPAPVRPARERVPKEGGGAEISSEQKILDALAWWELLGVTAPAKQSVAFIAGYTVGGRFNNLVGGLRSTGRLEYPSDGHVALTAEGRAVASYPEQPGTLAALHEAIQGKLDASQWTILEQVIKAHPHALEKEELAERAGYTIGGRFNNLLGSLRSLGLVTKKGPVAATALLFPKALAGELAAA